ncbi:hypothetical protein NSP_41730 [Nodularia spumigena CCY9414]|nr:hypothetical protein NSP_41730 [Nodularia spumigena CCY9414]
MTNSSLMVQAPRFICGINQSKIPNLKSLKPVDLSVGSI